MLGYVGFKILRLFVSLLDLISSLFCGYSMEKGWRSERSAAKEGEDAYSHCAHVTRVWWKSRKIELEGAKLTNFILRLERTALEGSSMNILLHRNLIL